jgi:hypothetical protein
MLLKIPKLWGFFVLISQKLGITIANHSHRREILPMEELRQIHQQYAEINERLNSLNEVISNLEEEGSSEDHMETLEQFTGFADRQIKSQLKKEEETLWNLKQQIGEGKAKDIREAIQEHGVLYGAIEQFAYGVKMQSEPDIMESAKSILEHFPPHIERVAGIAKNHAGMLQ